MSISSLANAAAARRPDFSPVNQVPKNLDEIAKAFSVPPGMVTNPLVDTSSNDSKLSGQGSSAVNTALTVLFGYIPTEILTLYVSVLAALNSGPKSNAGWITFLCFLVATPLVVWLVFGSKVLASNKSIPVSPNTWPAWEMFAATIAFCAWGFALPNSPFSTETWYSSGFAAIVVLIASTILGLLAPFFQRPLRTGETTAK
jgi:hypothetical protein